jgi:hypothetical protein
MSPSETDELREIAGKESNMIKHLLDQIIIERHGQMAEADGMLIIIVADKAEGWWELNVFGNLSWREPEPDENQHIEVIVADAEDNRMIPCLNVDVTILNEEGYEIGTQRQPMYWSPTIYYYGTNWSIPSEGSYDIRVHIDTPGFLRQDREMGNRFIRPITVEFTGMDLKPAREESGVI